MKKSPQDLAALVHNAGTLPDIAEKAELLNNLDQMLKQMVSGPVAEQLKVANLRHGTLVIETTTASWAARINFQKPMLLKQLQAETLPMLSAIEVKVNPRLAQYQPKPQVNNNRLSETAAAHIEALAQHTSGSLGEKLKRLAALASRNKRESS